MREEVEDIHIGKTINGRYILNHNNWVYYNNKSSLIEWLNTVEIQSDYGETISTKEFMDIVDKSQYSCPDPEKSGLIEVDGLWFSKSTKFS